MHTAAQPKTTPRRTLSGRNAAMAVMIGAVLTLGAAPSVAQQAAGDASPVADGIVTRVYACRAITDPAARLACFDREVGALETAQSSNQVRIIDREQVRQARRGLFGLSLPNLGSIFGGGDDEEDANGQPGEEEGITFIESRISRIGDDGTGRRVLILENGQQWVQIEAQRGRAPAAGLPVTIRRGILGSYIATVESRGTLRVMRTR